MTPTQLRAFSAVARLGSVKEAAHDLGVSEAAVSLHVGKLRKLFGDPLFSRTAAGLAFTPGGLRLAGRAADMLGLHDRTLTEVTRARGGERVLRVAASSLFAEYAAPGLIEQFVGRADDLNVELSVHDPEELPSLLAQRAVDVAVGAELPGGGGAEAGPRPGSEPGTAPVTAARTVLDFQMVTVLAPRHPLARRRVAASRLREHTWLLGPSAKARCGLVPSILRRFGVPAHRQRVFQSHAAALDRVRQGEGIGLALGFAVSRDLASGSLVTPSGPPVRTPGSWAATTLEEDGVPGVAAEFVRFATTARATQAMLRGTGVPVGHFRPAVHITLWS
ncbi:LysR family transcriptional regulator [Nocardiopsis sp. HNM0947]|uniref:LysR family transcriptional regulator n=1 Tax=Nocardiopsis coralli TaxID=2772213 RepID=A0ABR9P448_9ACTN|nr:LysR family transcriptional regulator [Nocardiopsis coralli]MBE2998607.1 LysR family transcriptional regulator [Nocardiopsis coralli]